MTPNKDRQNEANETNCYLLTVDFVNHTATLFVTVYKNNIFRTQLR